MKKLCLLFTIVCLLLCCVGCKKEPSQAEREQAQAYRAIFEDLYPYYMKSMTGKKEKFYVAVDISNVLFDYPDLIVEAIDEYVGDGRIMLLWNDMEGLIEEGHIDTDITGNALGFNNGVLLIFADDIITSTKLETHVTKWYGNIGAENYSFDVEPVDRKWTVTHKMTNWVASLPMASLKN